MNKKSENIKNGNLDFDWKGQFPTVPEQIHRSLVNTLEELPDALQDAPISSKVKSSTTALWRRGALLAAALVAVLGTTVAASEIFKWNERTIRYLHNPSEEIQNKFTNLGLTSIGGDSATVEGITVAVEQVVQDENTLYVALKVTAEEPIVGGWGFLKYQYVTDEGETLNLIPGTEKHSFYNDSYSRQSHAEEEPLTKEGYAFYAIHSNVVGKLTYDHLTLRLTDYNYSQYYTPVTAEEKEMFIEGCWELSIPLNTDSAKQLTKVYEVNQEVPMNAEPVTVKEITLTPFTLSIVGEASEDKEKRKEYSEKYDKWYQADGFGQKCIYGIKYKDGRVVDLSHNTAGLGTFSGVGAEREYYGEFNTIVDTNNVAAILFGENGEISIEVEETP